MKTYTIYKHTNIINNKSYIGQTCQDVEKRWGNGSGYKTCPIFYQAILKYGWDNFTHEILEENLTEDKVDEREIYWINFYNSQKEGYNFSSGGSGNHNFSEQHKQNIKKSVTEKLGKPVICINTKQIYSSINEAYRETGVNHIEDCCSGKIKSAGKDDNNIALVWRFLEEYDENEKIDFKKQIRSKTRVKCLNTGIIYNSGKEASKITGIDNGSLNKCLNGKRKSAGKDIDGKPLKWEYVD